MNAPASDPPPPPEPPAEERRYAVVQHALFWIGLGLLIALVVRGWVSFVYNDEVAARQNMLLPDPMSALTRDWFFTYPAAAALLAAFWFRLKRMVIWRGAGRRPSAATPVRISIAAGVGLPALFGAAVFAEQLLLVRPALLGDARHQLPGGGVYLFGPVGTDTGARDYGDPEVGFRWRPLLVQASTSCGNVAEGPAAHLIGRVPYRRTFWVTDDHGHIGYGDDSVSGPPEVITLGDSFTAGDGVPRRKTWSYLLGRRLDRPVYNMGIGGACPTQEVRLLQRHAPPGAAPKTVLLCVYEGNDPGEEIVFRDFLNRGEGRSWRDRRRLPSPRHARRIGCSLLMAVWRHWRTTEEETAPVGPEGALYLRPDNPPPRDPADCDEWDDDRAAAYFLPAGGVPDAPTDRLLPNRRWHEVPVTGAGVGLNPYRLTIGGTEVEMSVWSDGEVRSLANPAWDWAVHPGVARMREAFRELAAHCRAHGARGVVLFAPAKAHVYWEWIDAQVGDARLPAMLRERFRLHRGALRDAVGAAAREAGLEFLDLTPALRDAASRGGPPVYLHHDTHWSPAGHEAVADAVASHLRGVR
jgi:hypothetical protein